MTANILIIIIKQPREGKTNQIKDACSVVGWKMNLSKFKIITDLVRINITKFKVSYGFCLL